MYSVIRIALDFKRKGLKIQFFFQGTNNLLNLRVKTLDTAFSKSADCLDLAALGIT